MAEYRFWVVPRGIAFTDVLRIERLGLAPFVEAGSVAGSLDALPRARVHADYGIGFRMALERNATFRVDAGFSNEGPNFSVAFGLKLLALLRALSWAPRLALRPPPAWRLGCRRGRR